MSKKHAKLSASGAHRWMICPKSVALEAQFPDTTSEYAQEGTEAHNIAEKNLKRRLKTPNTKNKPDMDSYIQGYVDYCLDLYNQAKIEHKDVLALVEERLNFNSWVPGGFGTGDFVLISPEKLIIVDLKYGKGVKVDAEDNPQLRLYGLGGISEYGWIYPFKTIEMHIYQPRLNHISVEVMGRNELEIWGEGEVIPKAKLASKNEGEFVPGEHCRFCKAGSVCKARTEFMLDQIKNIVRKEK